MNSKFKIKTLLFIMMLSVICGSECRVSAGINPDIARVAEARGENALNEHLFISVGLGTARTVENDLRQGANIHALDRALQTPLHFAIRRIFEAQFMEGSLDVLDILLGYGADPDFRVNLFPERNLQTPYEYFETHYSGDINQDLVAAVRERLNYYRFTAFAPTLPGRRIPHHI